MISNEDRVEAARFLRSCNCDTESYAKCYEISEALFGNKYAICDFNVPCGKIADLIDRPTIIPEASGPGFWRCPACGAFNRNDAVWDCCGPIPANRCGNCGSLIVK